MITTCYNDPHLPVVVGWSLLWSRPNIVILLYAFWERNRFTNVSRVLQNNLMKIYNAINRRLLLVLLLWYPGILLNPLPPFWDPVGTGKLYHSELTRDQQWLEQYDTVSIQLFQWRGDNSQKQKKMPCRINVDMTLRDNTVYQSEFYKTITIGPNEAR